LKVKIKQLFTTSKLASASSWLVAGGITGGMLGYFFQVAMGRMLSVADYGVLSALMAIMVVIGAPLSTLSMVVSRQVSIYRSTEASDNLVSLFYWMNRKVFLISILLIMFAIAYIKYLQDFLLIENRNHIYLLLGIFLITLPYTINLAYFQGLKYFKWLSASGILVIFFKIIIAILLVYFGFGVTGALGGVLLSTFITFIVTYIVLYPLLNNNTSRFKDNTHILFKSVIPVLLANIAFSVMTQIDMIVVKHYFSQQDAGIYAAASILGKAVMYLPAGISMALLPMVAESHANEKSSAHLMFQAIGVTALLCMFGALLYYFFADFIIIFLYGTDYKEAAEILKYFGFAMLPMALIMVAEYFLIAMGRVLFAYLFVIVAPLQLIAIYNYHDTLLDIVAIISITGVILVVTGYGLLWKEFKK